MPSKSKHAHPTANETIAAATTVTGAETRAQEAEIRRLRLTRLERELFGPWPDVPRKRRPNVPVPRRFGQ